MAITEQESCSDKEGFFLKKRREGTTPKVPWALGIGAAASAAACVAVHRALKCTHAYLSGSANGEREREYTPLKTVEDSTFSHEKACAYHTRIQEAFFLGHAVLFHLHHLHLADSHCCEGEEQG